MPHIWTESRENQSSGCPAKRISNQSPQLQRLARNLISSVASFHMMLSKKRITKALNRLCGCAGWSAPVLFVNPRKTGFLASRAISSLSPTTLINSLGGILIRTPYHTLEKQFDPLCKNQFAGQCILEKMHITLEPHHIFVSNFAN